ncbi:MAG: ImmA/IrrE family metallo-endopeptidase [Bacteroidales bacterium]
MLQNIDDIKELAENIGLTFLENGKVNLFNVAKNEDITILNYNYNHNFLGSLTYCNGKFYIILNKREISKCEIGRVRFTIAHELGHFFIDEQRNRLKNGVSILFTKGEETNNRFVKQNEELANTFAANLLLPRKDFIENLKLKEFGIPGLLSLKDQYKTSLECTLNHFINLNLTTSLIVKWDNNNLFNYARGSELFLQKFELSNKYIPVKIDWQHILKTYEDIEKNENEFSETITSFNRWVSISRNEIKKDIIGIEQIVNLGEFGGMALITFN